MDVTRSARGEETKKRILAAARSLLAQGGVDRFTTRRVASVAGISHGQCHYHFPTKRDLILALIEDARSDWVDPLTEHASATTSVEERMRVIIDWIAEPATADVMRVHQTLYTFALDDDEIRSKLAAEYADWRNTFVDLFEELQETLDLRELEAELVGGAFASAADGLVQQQTLDPAVPTAALLSALLDRLLQAERVKNG